MDIGMIRIIIICVAAVILVLLGIAEIRLIQKDKKAYQESMNQYGAGEPQMNYQMPAQNTADINASFQNADYPNMEYEAPVPKPVYPVQAKPVQAQPEPVYYNQMPEEPVGQVSFQNQEERKSVVWKLEGLRGYFKGKTMLIDGEVAIGRDTSRCQLLYPLTYKGVSGLHCRLRVENENLYLEDQGSSYGTYLENKEKIPANKPVQIQSGSVFFLVNQDEQFRVMMQ